MGAVAMAAVQDDDEAYWMAQARELEAQVATLQSQIAATQAEAASLEAKVAQATAGRADREVEVADGLQDGVQCGPAVAGYGGTG